MARQTPAGSSPASLWGLVIAGVSAFIAAISLVGTVGTMRLAPIDKKLEELDTDIKSINVLMAPLLTLNAQQTANLAAAAAQHSNDLASFAKIETELNEKTNDKLFNAAQVSISKTLDEISHQVHSLESEIVTRSEHTQQNAQLADRLTSLERRIDALTLLVEGSKETVHEQK